MITILSFLIASGCSICIGTYTSTQIDFSAGIGASMLILGSWLIIFFMQLLDKEVNNNVDLNFNPNHQ